MLLTPTQGSGDVFFALPAAKAECNFPLLENQDVL